MENECIMLESLFITSCIVLMGYLIARFQISQQRFDHLWNEDPGYYRYHTYIPDNRYNIKLTQALCFHRYINQYSPFKRQCIQCDKIDWIWRMRTIR